jgi:pimeloyl-ACP methyl ester carboxylesterase/ketosteroid isomerase-like protein
MSASNTVRRAGTLARITVAGMAADLYGFADERPPLVLLPGLTFDRRIWQPVLGQLARIDPGRQVLALDLPGHGESPDQLPHSMPHIVGLIHRAVQDAGLDAPVMVGHSIAGGFASIYAGQHRTSGVINIDAPPDPALFALLRSMEGEIRGDGFPGVWAKMEQGFRTDLLPLPARHLVAHNSRPRQDLVVSYWDDILTQTSDQLNAMLTGGVSAIAASGVPYLLILGAEPDPGSRQRFGDALPQLKTEVWADTGHFPHLAHPGRFAQRLAATAQWLAGQGPAGQDAAPERPEAGFLTPADMDWIIDAHFEAEGRGDVEAILATVSDDISHEVLGAGLGKLRGKDAVRAFYEQLSQDLTIDAYTSVRRLHGPGHAWEEGLVHATATGKPFGLDGRDRRVIYRLDHLFEFRNGLIHSELGIPDVASILAQLSQPE